MALEQDDRAKGEKPKPEEAERFNVWQQLFVALNEYGQAMNVPVDRLAPDFRFATPQDEFPQRFEHSLRINPAGLTKDGKPRFVVLNAGFRERNTQEVILEAEWHENEPRVIVLDPSKFANATAIIPYTDLAEYAVTMIRHRIEHARKEHQSEPAVEQAASEPAEEPKKGFTLLMPDDYASGVN